MVDFEKIIRATPESLKEDVDFQEQKDTLHLHPELREYAIAGYLAQQIAFTLIENFEKVRQKYKEQIELDAPPLMVTQAIGALQILAQALTLDLVEDSLDPQTCAIHLMMLSHNYSQMVPDLRAHLRKVRPDDDQG